MNEEVRKFRLEIYFLFLFAGSTYNCKALQKWRDHFNEQTRNPSSWLLQCIPAGTSSCPHSRWRTPSWAETIPVHRQACWESEVCRLTAWRVGWGLSCSTGGAHCGAVWSGGRSSRSCPPCLSGTSCGRSTETQREDSLRNCLGNGTFQTSKVFIDFDFNVFF